MNVCKLLHRVSIVSAVLSAGLTATFSIAAGPGVSTPCDEFVAKLPNMQRALCESARLQPSAARSVKGRTLWVRDIQPDSVTMHMLVIGAIHSGVHKGVPVVTIELPNSTRTPLDTEMRQMWRDLQGWMLRHLGQSQQLPFQPVRPI